MSDGQDGVRSGKGLRRTTRRIGPVAVEVVRRGGVGVGVGLAALLALALAVLLMAGLVVAVVGGLVLALGLAFVLLQAVFPGTVVAKRGR